MQVTAEATAPVNDYSNMSCALIVEVKATPVLVAKTPPFLSTFLITVK